MKCPICKADMVYMEPEPPVEVHGIVEPGSPAEWWCGDENCDGIVVEEDN